MSYQSSKAKWLSTSSCVANQQVSSTGLANPFTIIKPHSQLYWDVDTKSGVIILLLQKGNAM